MKNPFKKGSSFRLINLIKGEDDSIFDYSKLLEDINENGLIDKNILRKIINEKRENLNIYDYKDSKTTSIEQIWKNKKGFLELLSYLWLLYNEEFIDDFGDIEIGFKNLNNEIEKCRKFEDPFPIFREISVNSAEVFVERLRRSEYYKGYDGLGVSWTWVKEKAEAYWGYADNEYIIITALTEKSNVDWIETILLNTSLYSGGECEINMEKGMMVSVMRIEAFNYKDEQIKSYKLNKELKI
jgi:hypothetical protein